MSLKFDDSIGLAAAIEQAKKSAAEGGVPIGSSLVMINEKGEHEVLAASHNQRIQKGSATLHGEISALEAAGRLKANVYRKCTIVSRILPRI